MQADLKAFFRRLVPPANDPSMSYLEHRTEGPDDMPAHIKAALTQTSLSIPVIGGRMALGTWQGIYLFEHRDAPHNRRVVAHTCWKIRTQAGAGRPPEDRQIALKRSPMSFGSIRRWAALKMASPSSGFALTS